MAFNYVDDTVVLVRAETAWHTAACVGVFMCMLGVPLSWHKLTVGPVVQYIGFRVNLKSWSLGLAAERVARLNLFLCTIRRGARLDKAGLAKGIGQLQWATAIVPTLRPWLAELYRMLNLPGLHWGWLDEDRSREVFKAMREDGSLAWAAGGFAAGMSLSFVGKRVARCKEDWRGLWSSGRGSVAFADWEARRVRVTRSAVVASSLWANFLAQPRVDMPVCRRRVALGAAAADAFASGDWASLGGWWTDSGELDVGSCWWFRLEIHRADLDPWIHIKGDMQDDIAFFECMAQVVLLALRTQNRACRGKSLHQGCDNQTSVGALRKRLSTKEPLSVAVQAMSVWERHAEVAVKVHYLPGEENEAADQLSRWRKRGLVGFDLSRERMVSLRDVLGKLPVCPSST